METLIGIIIGAVVGYFVALKYGYISRVIFRIQPKCRIVFFNAQMEKFVSDNDNKSPIFRIAITEDKLKDSITLYFSHFYNNGNTKFLNKEFNFYYYDKGWDRISNTNKFYIDYLKDDNFLPFIEKISSIPIEMADNADSGMRISNTLEDLKQKLNIS